MKLYKLTDSKGNTRNNTRWDIGISHEVTGVPKLCSNTVLHAYTSPLLACLMNAAHANYNNPKCFEVEGDISISDSTKVGCQRLIVTGIFKLPEVSLINKIAFGILCAKEICKKSSFTLWADNWLSGKDRSYDAANAANAAAYATAAAAADATVYAAAANAAAAAADDAAAYAAAYAANAAAYAANAAANAANKEINFQELAEQAMEIK